jgi:alcohol dehydrogenase YqhD (iron-dependent ADH family)
VRVGLRCDITADPARQLGNDIYDATIHWLDNYLAPEPSPLLDLCHRAIVGEFVTNGLDAVKDGASPELRERLIMAASFALNFMFTLGKRGCVAIHMIGH